MFTTEVCGKKIPRSRSKEYQRVYPKKDAQRRIRAFLRYTLPLPYRKAKLENKVGRREDYFERELLGVFNIEKFDSLKFKCIIIWIPIWRKESKSPVLRIICELMKQRRVLKMNHRRASFSFRMLWERDKGEMKFKATHTLAVAQHNRRPVSESSLTMRDIANIPSTKTRVEHKRNRCKGS